MNEKRYESIFIVAASGISLRCRAPRHLTCHMKVVVDLAVAAIVLEKPSVGALMPDHSSSETCYMANTTKPLLYFVGGINYLGCSREIS